MSNVSLVVASNADDEVVLSTVESNVKNEKDITLTQIIPALYEKKVNVDNDDTDCEFPEINTNKPPQGELIQDEMTKQVINLDDYKKDKQPFEDNDNDNVAAEDLPIRIKEVEGDILNNAKHGKNKLDDIVNQFTIALQSPIGVKSEDVPNILPTDKADKIKPIVIDDNYVDATQDINNDRREKSNFSLIVAPNADDDVVLCYVESNVKNDKDITPTQIIPALYEKKVNEDNDVTNCDFAEINTNKQGELIQDEMAKQVINLDGYKKDEQPFEDMPADNVASEDLSSRAIEVEGDILNNIKHGKNQFDEIVNQFTIALQSPIGVKSEDVPNIIPTDKADKIKPIAIDDNYVDATHDINNDRRDESNVSLIVAPNADDDVVLCSVESNVKNEQDITSTQIIPALYDKKVNVDNDVTDCEFYEINTNKPPQGELIQDAMTKQVINLDDYKKDKQPFEDNDNDNVAAEDLPIRIKEVEGVILNNAKHGKNKLDDVVNQFTIALQSPIRVKSKDIPNIIPNATQDINKEKTHDDDVPNIIPTDKADKIRLIVIDDNYVDATQDINNDRREESNVSLIVAPNADDDVVLCSVESNVKNEQDITSTQIIPALYDKKVNVDNDVTDCEFYEINTNKPRQGELIQDEMAKQVINLDDNKKDEKLLQDMPAINVASEDQSTQVKEVEGVILNNIKHGKNQFDEVVNQFTIALQSPIRVKSKDIPNIIPNATQDINKEKTHDDDVPNIIPTDKADKIKPIVIDHNYVDATQDINNDRREKSNVSLIVAPNADDDVVLCSGESNVKNEQDITPTQRIPALYEKKVNVDNDVTDCEFAEININKPPQGELIQDEMAKQVINLDDNKKDEKPFQDMPADNVASVDQSTRVKEVEGVILNNIKHGKNQFDEVVNQFTIALQSPIRVKSKDIPNIIPNATQDINKDQREKSNVSLVVSSNVDDEVVQCSLDDNVKNEPDENETTYNGINLPSQENIDDISANNATLTNVSDSSDEESTPKKSKRFTFTDSDFPDSDEAREILMSYPKPTVEEYCSESESEHSSDDEIYEFLHRCWNKTEPDKQIDFSRMIGIENLPDRVMTRLRSSAPMFKPNYLKEQEDQINEDIILENIKRLKSFKNSKTYEDSKKQKSIKKEKKETTPRKNRDNKSNKHKRKVNVKIKKSVRKKEKTKTKSFARKNTKEDSLELNSISAAKTTIRKTRSMKKEKDGKKTENKCLGNKNKKPDNKRKSYKKERTIFPEIEGRRSKRQQKTIEINEGTMKAPISTLKKSKPKQSTVYNSSPSSSELPKSLKRSLADDGGVPSPKRTRSHNNSINNTSMRAIPVTAVKIQHAHHLSAFPDPYVYLERYEPAQKQIRTLNSNRNFLTRCQFARRRLHRACKPTREAARTSTKR